MKSLLILFFTLPVIFFGQNNPGKKDITGTSTYTVCNPDSSGTFQLMYNDMYNIYGLFKTSRRTYYYNSNNKNSYGVHQYCTMNVNDTVWNNHWKWTNFYDSNNLLTDSVNQYWDGGLNQWADTADRTHYIYDSNHNITTINKFSNYGTWTAKSRILNTYNSSNQLITSKFQKWDTTSHKWFIYDSLQCIYDSNNHLTTKHYYYNNTDPISWYYNAKDTIHYNSSNLPVYLLKTINLGNGGWMTAKEINWTYDGNDRILSIVSSGPGYYGSLSERSFDDHYSYDSFGRQKLDLSSGFLIYSNCNFIGVNENTKNAEFSISPNPTNSYLFIDTSVDYGIIKIINSIGQTVLIQENKQEPISVSNLSNGIYFMQLLDKKWNLLKTEKFIKE
ncbi:MAG: T9SS type A sorting domain-containing protein [Bacteroidia bacterium]